VGYTYYPGTDPYFDDLHEDADGDNDPNTSVEEEYICLPTNVPLTETGIREYVRRCNFKFYLENRDPPHPHEGMFEGSIIDEQIPEIVEIPSSQ
jgi:hypothetical protein